MIIKNCLFVFLSIISLTAFAQDTLSVVKNLSFRNVGPTRGGRVTTVTGIPDQPNVFFMGSTGGGVWKTTNDGQSWNNISDGYFHTGSIGAIRVAASNPKVIYVGTGSDGLRSNVITGKGVYKSSNGGKTWEHKGLKEVGQIGAVEIDPASPDRVFVAAIGQAFAPNAERGVYRTLDGGDTWEKVLYIADTVGIVDIEFAPDNSQTLYAAAWRAERKPWTIISGGENGGIYKSTDGGDSWEKLTKGLPEGIIGKIDLAVSADDPDRLYALVEAPLGEGGLYRSHDRGASFELVSTKNELLDRPFYYCNVDANPRNADAVYVNSTGFYKSYNAGKTWTRQYTPHGDNHDIWINPNDTLVCIQSNDGGANVSRDGMKTWSTQENQSTAELYQVNVDDQFPYWIYAGQQDNSTIAVPSMPPHSSISGATAFWMAVGGCETGPVVPKPGNPNIVYANCKGRFGVYNKQTGQEKQYYVGAANMYGHNPQDLKYRFQRVSPIHVSPHNPDLVYHASQYLHRTTDDGETWETISPDLTAFTPETQVISGTPITRDITGEEFYSTIYAVMESPVEQGVIWTGANDGPVYITRNGGDDWKEITPADLPPGGRVQTLEASPHKPGKAYIAVYRYLLGDWGPYIYKTENYGETWEMLTDGTNGIPDDYPTRVIREDPDVEGLLYAGTEFGLFLSYDDGKKWYAFQQNLPVTPITDIKVFRQDLILSTMGRGFWIMDDIHPLHQSGNTAQLDQHMLFEPGDAYRVHIRGNNPNSIPYYPAPGVYFDYYLEQEVEDEIILEILNDQDQVIRAFSSEHSTEDSITEQEVSMATGFRSLGSGSTLNTAQGHHRVKWDMRHEGLWHEEAHRSGSYGTLVAPGTYQVRMNIAGQSMKKSFEIVPDPRLNEEETSLADMKAQEALSLKVLEIYNVARKMAYKYEQRKEELEAELEKDYSSSKKYSMGEELKSVENMLSKLNTAEGRYMTPQLVNQIGYLYSMLMQADQRPGQDAYDRYEELKAAFEQLKSEEEEDGSR